MSGITIANRYAKALADVMTERKESNEVFAELSRFSSLIAGHSELREVFANPVLALDRKSGVLKGAGYEAEAASDDNQLSSAFA
ncbi:MAG: F0F1 ATP synthase subunit delta [Acidobacteria bacterium]|nr:F0F1 ATP synthase subunit delta [Acidobacteriota bacterium]